MKRIGVIGAGTSGLVAAALLIKQGFEVAVFEKLARIGGRAPTVEREGFVLDAGPHCLRSGADGVIAATLAGLGIELELIPVPPPELLFYEAGEFREFPRGAKRLGECDFLTDREKKVFFQVLENVQAEIEKNMDVSLADWVEHVGGGEGLRMFTRVAALGIVCPDLERASAGELLDFLVTSMQRGETRTAYLVGGYGVIHQHLGSFIEANGGQLHLGAAVRQVEIDRGKAIGVVLAERTEKVDAVVCTVPAGEAPSLFPPDALNKDKEARLCNLVPTAGVSIDFALAEEVTDLQRVVVHPGEPFVYGYSPSNLWAEAAPAGRQLLCFGALAKPEQVLSPASCDRLFQALRQRVAEMFPKMVEKVLWERPMAFPVLDGVEPTITQHRRLRPGPKFVDVEGLYLAGDYLGVAGSGGDLAVTSAIACVDALRADLT